MWFYTNNIKALKTGFYLTNWAGSAAFGIRYFIRHSASPEDKTYHQNMTGGLKRRKWRQAESSGTSVAACEWAERPCGGLSEPVQTVPSVNESEAAAIYLEIHIYQIRCIKITIWWLIKGPRMYRFKCLRLFSAVLSYLTQTWGRY